MSAQADPAAELEQALQAAIATRGMLAVAA